MITLQKLAKNDIEYFLELNNDPNNLYWMESDEHYLKEDVPAIMRYKNVTWYVIYNTTLEPLIRERVGLFTTYVVNDKAYLGIIIEDEHRRKGYARDSFVHFLRACDDMNLDTNLRCFADNPAVSIYKMLGYKPVGESIEIRGREFFEMKRTAKTH